MNNIDKFIDLFSEFKLIVEPKTKKIGSKPIKMTSCSTNKTKSDLKKALKRLKEEYKRAQKSFKANKISKQELFDFEWRMFELKEELRKIEGDDLK